MSAAADEPTRAICPMCGNRSLGKHCPTSPNCRWGKCNNLLCEATLDFGHGIGFYLDPRKIQDKTVKAVRKLRLIHVNDGNRKGWFERDIVGS